MKIVILSGHDYRSKRKASIHFIAECWSRNHQVRFFSVGYSLFSITKQDSRSHLFGRANRIENYRGVDCFLDRSLVHPCSLPGAVGSALNQAWVKNYVRRAPAVLRTWALESDLIVVDAGLALAYLAYLKALNNNARYLYHASDSLETLRCAPYLKDTLAQHLGDFAGVRVPSPALLRDLPKLPNLFFIPHGHEPSMALRSAPRPFGSGLHAVSVGSMLFESAVIDQAAEQHPCITFHVIGAGFAASRLNRANIINHHEMPFAKTQEYIEHADFGIAPYDRVRVPEYLADSSLKLMQFSSHGIPAICPLAVTRGLPYRFGYSTDRATVKIAIEKALSYGRFDPVRGQTWDQTAQDFLRLAFRQSPAPLHTPG